MELEQYNISVDQVQYSSLKDILTRYIFHWKWFVISLICSFLFGFVYLRYQVPQYEASAKILIKDENKGTISDELSAFEDLGILNGKKNIDNEIEILKSRTLMKRVVKELKLNISYFSFGGGGGGGVYQLGTIGTGGSGGGGAAGTAVTTGGSTGVAGTANRGGGGGGASYGTADVPGGDGGSGVVILRYLTADGTITIGAGLTGSTATDGSHKVTTLTAGTGNVSWA